MSQCSDRIIQIIRKNKEKIKKHLESLKEICLVADNLSFMEKIFMEKELLDGNVTDIVLFSFIDSGIRMTEMTDDIFNELKSLIPKSVEVFVIPESILKLNCKMSDFPRLKEFVSSSYFDLSENTLDDELANVKRVKFPTEGELGKLFLEDFIVSYLHDGRIGLDSVEVYDRRDDSDSLLSSGILSITLDSKMVIKNLKIRKLSIKEVSLILEWLKKEKNEFLDVTLVLENKTNSDIELLEYYLDDFNISIDYGEYIKASYEDFVSMRATIDWYKEIVTVNDLSPFEKLIFAYDIMKTFTYKEGDNLEDSRCVPNIIRTGNIVCVGYSKMLEMIINEMGIKSVGISIAPTKDEAGHRRVAVKLDDDKYDIHGLFATDATWDRGIDELSLVENVDGQQVIRRSGRREGDKVIKEYDALALYNCFLIPYSDYQKIFWDEEVPDIFKIFERNIGYDYDYFDGCSMEFKKLFGSIDKSYIKNYICNSEKPSLEKFREALSVVRKAEGYVADEVPMLVDDTITLNQMLDESGVFFMEEGINKK